MNSPVVFPGGRGVSKPLFSGYPDLLTVQHLAEITGSAEQTIRRAMDEGQIPFVRIGRRRYSPKSKFIEYVEGGANGE